MQQTTSARLKRFLIVLTVLTLAIFGAVVALALTNPVLSVSGKTDTTVSLSWTDGGDETKYLVKQKVGTQFNTIATLPANTLTYTVTGLAPNTTYQFYVAASKDKGAAYNSNTVTVTTLGAPPPTTTTVPPPPPTNVAPSVSAGPDLTITLPSTATLDGTVTDDGLPNPPAMVTTTWSTVSGPGTVTFGNASAVDTTVMFSVDGIYVVRLTASDSALSASDDATITVNPEPVTTTTPPPPPPSCVGTNVAPGTGLPAAVSAAPAGTTFCLSVGTYTLNAQPLFQTGDVVQGAGIDATFLVHNNSNDTMFAFTGTQPFTVAMYDLDITAPYFPPPGCTTVQCGGRAFSNGQVTWEDVRCHDAGVACIAGGANNTSFNRVECLNNGYHTAALDPATRSSACIKQNVGSIHVTNSLFQDNAWVAVWCDFCDGGEMVVEDSSFIHNGRGGVSWEVSGQAVAGDHAVIRNNIFHDNGWNEVPLHGGGHAAIICNDCAHLLIELNTFGNNFATDAGGGGLRAVWLIDGTRVAGPLVDIVIQNNTLNGDRIDGCSLEGVTCSGNV